jgi:cation diffusion facilitator CzcD-associated flavoprotein CzcO
LAHAEAVRGLTRVFDSLAVSAASAAARLAEMTGQGTGNAAMATLLANFFTHTGGLGSVPTAFGLTGVGSENLVEAEIQRRQATRVGAEGGLVGNLSPIYAEISRRLFFRDDKAAINSRVDADLVAVYLQFFTRLVVNV